MWSAILCGVLTLPAAADEKQLERYPRADLLVEATELARSEGPRRFHILDAGTAEKYRAGHIPGAQLADATKWHQLFLSGADPKVWQEQFASLGIDADTPILVYAEDLRDAARIWWLLRYWGVQNVRLLDGGWQAWQAAGGKV